MKSVLLHIAKQLGLFHLTRWLTARRPRILCYHGLSIEDEHEFRPGLFMRKETFAARMQLLDRWGMRLVSLDTMRDATDSDTTSRHMLAITIDDGWAGIENGMLPELARRGYSATLYLSTYFVIARRPVFKVAVAYLFWKYRRAFQPGARSCTREITIDTELDEQQVLDIAKSLGASREQELLEELCEFYGESLAAWQRSGKFYFLDSAAVRDMAAKGIGIELHTHRHRFSEIDLASARAEVEENRRIVENIVGTAPRHFCYPRGEYYNEQLDMLQSLGIRTATTTRNELVSLDDSPLEWSRIVDSDAVSDLEFEAEITGFMSLVRRLTAPMRRR